MAITSFSYFVFIAIGALFYYILPKSLQWVELLILSIIYYCFAATPYTFVYIIISATMAWAVTNGNEIYKEKNGEYSESKLWKVLIVLSIVVNIVLWFIFKGTALINTTVWAISKVIPFLSGVQVPQWIGALGMGYYTLQIIGYTLDCYWGNANAQKNPLKLLLFAAFFPQMVTGPISRYDQLQGLYQKHTISYENIAHGVQRIIWGMFKKIVVSERAAIIVNCVWADFATYDGIYTWIALLLYPLQMYADFSGCMDIVIGTAEIFDIKLPENFNNPFFSKSSQEFWQRWHMSLGNWARDYVLYPVLKTKWMVNLGKKLKKKFGKKTGKFLATAVGMFILWMVMGIWHGAYKYIIGVSLWYWIILMLGDLTRPYTDKMCVKLGFRTETFGWRLFQCLRTYVIYAVGAAFFRANGISQAISFFKELITTFTPSKWNPWVLMNGSILNTGITHVDLNIIYASVLILIIVAILREKYGYARAWIDKQPVLIRWGVYISLLVAVFVFGAYGPGYEASAFIYGQF